MTGRVTVQWDGNDNNATVISYTGLSGVDLTGGATNDGFHVAILGCDHDAKLAFSAYTDSSNWSDMTLNLPAATYSERMDVFFPFTSFTDHGTGVDWENVGAIVMNLDGTIVAELDFAADFVEVSSVREYGDLPSDYGTDVLNANHIPQGLKLGNNVDAETTYNASTAANGDDTNDFDDEDGVLRDMNYFWTPGATVDLLITVEGCSGTCYLNGWIDWSNNSSFDSGEQVFTDTTTSNVTNQSRSILIPSTYITGTDVYARFRLCTASGSPPTGCNSTTGQVNNGEVEDYFWLFGPNAVTLTRLEATSAPSRLPVGTAAVALALLASGAAVGGVFVRRRRNH